MARLFTIDRRGWEAPCERLGRSERAHKLQANSVEFISVWQNGLNIDDILYPFESFGRGFARFITIDGCYVLFPYSFECVRTRKFYCDSAVFGEKKGRKVSPFGLDRLMGSHWIHEEKERMD